MFGMLYLQVIEIRSLIFSWKVYVSTESASFHLIKE